MLIENRAVWAAVCMCCRTVAVQHVYQRWNPGDFQYHGLQLRLNFLYGVEMDWVLGEELPDGGRPS
jgi:hypothetical protein